jgi:Protein of unknown function (DUF3352)
VIPPDPGTPETPPTPPMPTDTWAAQPPANPKRRRWPRIAAAVVAVLLMGGAATAFVMLRGAGEKLLNKIPAQTDVAVVAYLNPSAGQKVNLLRLQSHFPPLGTDQKVRDEVNKSLDSMLSGIGLDHSDAGWVGSEVAVTVDFQSSGDPAVALLFSTKDASAARSTMEKLQAGSAGADLTWTTEDHGGVQVSTGRSSGSDSGIVYAVFDGVAVVGNSTKAIENVIDTDQGKLAALDTSTEFKTTMADLPAGKLGFIYVDPSSIARITGQNPAFQTGVLGPFGTNSDAVKGLAVTVSAQPDGLAVDTSIRYDPSKLSADQRAKMVSPAKPNALLSSVPSDAYAVISLVGLDRSIKSALDQAGSQASLPPGVSDLLDSLSGDLAIEASPASAGTPSGAVIIGSKNDAMMQSSFDQLASAIPAFFAGPANTGPGQLSGGARWKTQDYSGATIRYLTVSPGGVVVLPTALSPAYAVVHGEVIVATSLDAMHKIIDASKGGSNVTTNANFVAASRAVPAGGTFLFVDARRIVADIRSQLPPDLQATFDKGAGQYLQPLQWIAAGFASDASHDRERFFVRI